MPSKIIDSFFRNSEDSYFGINEKYNSWMKQVVNNKKKKFFNKSSFKWLNNKSLYTKQIIKFLSLSLSLSISHSLSLISIKKKIHYRPNLFHWIYLKINIKLYVYV